MMKSNRVICSADANFFIYKTDNPYYDDNDNNKKQYDDIKGIFEQEEAQYQRKGREFDSPNPYSFLFTILFKLKLGSTPIFKFIIAIKGVLLCIELFNNTIKNLTYLIITYRNFRLTFC